jgi:hypothetical protein
MTGERPGKPLGVSFARARTVAAGRIAVSERRRAHEDHIEVILDFVEPIARIVAVQNRYDFEFLAAARRPRFADLLDCGLGCAAFRAIYNKHTRRNHRGSSSSRLRYVRVRTQA